MALTEALRLVIDADTRGAVQGLTKVGNSAEKELKKANTGLDRFGAGLSKAGVGMVTTGALLVGGLVKTAQASEEARLNMLKLENSVANNSKLAGHSAQEYADLADAIQDKTAADADDIIGGQAVLAQMGMESDQIKELTPLIVDLARKKGMDLVSASTLAAKAVDGNAGALKRAGIQVDETKFKTDAYGAVVDALSDSVGGFAEEEGKTFAGSLERMKNQLGDVAEGVGVGAVDAFSSMLNVMDPMIDKFTSLDPKVQGTVGKFAAFGAAGLIFVGAASTVIGKAIQMRENFNNVGISLRNSAGGLTRWGKAAAGLGIAGTVVGLVQLARASADFTTDIEALTRSLGDNTAASREQMKSYALAANKYGHLDDAVKDMADSNVVLAEKLIDAAEAAGIDADQIADLREITDNKRASDIAGAEAQEQYSGEMAEATGSSEELTGALEEQKDALDELLTATLAQFDANIGYRQAVDGVQDSLTNLNEVQKEHGSDSEEYQDALLDTESSLLGQAEAAVRLAEDTAKANGQTLSGKEKTAIYKGELERLRDTLKPGSSLRTALDRYIETLARIPRSINSTVTLRTVSLGNSLTEQYLGRSRGFSSGGPVYAANGAYFQPRGTDTVPAMLTPGEYVMQKSAVDRIGVDTLAAMNRGAAPKSGGGDTIVIQVGDREIARLYADGKVRADRRGFAA